MEYLYPVLEWVLPVAASILTIVLTIFAKRWLEKMGVERSEKVDDMIDRYVELGVDAAQRAGANYLAARGEKMPGGSKKAKAVKVVLSELEQSGIKGVTEELIAARIEGWLEAKDPKVSTGEPTSPESTEV